MTNFDALYSSVTKAAEEAIGTEGITDSLKSEINDTIIAAATKDEFKEGNVKLLSSNLGFAGKYDDVTFRICMEKPIAMFNAITAFMHSPNYAEVRKGFGNLDNALNVALEALREHNDGEIAKSHARLKYSICPTCGASYKLYVFDKPFRDKEVNVPSVYGVIKGNNCWYCSNPKVELPW